jgi:hypothetical protein
MRCRSLQASRTRAPSSLFGSKIVFLPGTEGAEAFYNTENISREDAHPFPLVQLFGGVNMEMYDGPRHFALWQKLPPEPRDGLRLRLRAK